MPKHFSHFTDTLKFTYTTHKWIKVCRVSGQAWQAVYLKIFLMWTDEYMSVKSTTLKQTKINE